jgi:hypothetical protein
MYVIPQVAVKQMLKTIQYCTVTTAVTREARRMLKILTMYQLHASNMPIPSHSTNFEAFEINYITLLSHIPVMI